MNNIDFSIKRIRNQKGFSQDYMAAKLHTTQASYYRMENQKVKLPVDKLLQIADILETDVPTLLDSSKQSIQNQTSSEGIYENRSFEILNSEYKEMVKKLIETFENEIETLKDEKETLRKEIEYLHTIVKADNP